MARWTTITIEPRGGMKKELSSILEEELHEFGDSDDFELLYVGDLIVIELRGYTDSKAGKQLLEHTADKWTNAGILANSSDDSGSGSAYKSTNRNVIEVSSTTWNEGERGKRAAEELRSELGFRPALR